MTQWVLVVGGVVGSVNLSHKILWNSGTPSCLLSCLETSRQQFLAKHKGCTGPPPDGQCARGAAPSFP